jgi:hypothetical protein
MRHLIPLLLAGCVPVPKDSAPAIFDTSPPEPVSANFNLLDAGTGRGAAGFVVEFPDGEVTTGADGQARGDVAAEEPFALRARASGYVDHLLFGPAGQESFTFVTYVASESITSLVLSMLGLSWQSGLGFVVVGVDYQDLSPVEGATVTLGAEHGQPFVFASGSPVSGATIPAGGMGFVSFPNVAPGDVTVELQPPVGVACEAHPGGGTMPALPVEAGAVTVATFQCR